MELNYALFIKVYFLSLSFSCIYRRIKNPVWKKWLGSAFGIFLIFYISKILFINYTVCVIVNGCIILFANPEKCHMLSFIFQFSYLTALRIIAHWKIVNWSTHEDIVLMHLILKLVGLAFEVNSDKQTTNERKFPNSIKNLTAVDILHYYFTFINVSTGPYYTYQTFQDSFSLPFAQYASIKNEIGSRLQQLLFFGTLNGLLMYFCSLPIVVNEDFYNRYSWLNRIWCALISSFVFRLKMYSFGRFLEITCILANFGAYPAKSEPKPGIGPTKHVEQLNKMVENEETLKIEKFSFETLNCFNPINIELCTTVTEMVRGWNSCIQYWLAVNVYQRLSHHRFRKQITVLVSMLWHSAHPGYLLCFGAVGFYLLLEDTYVKRIKASVGSSWKFWKWIIWFLKMQVMAYFLVPFHLVAVDEMLRYYQSTYYIGFIFLFIALIAFVIARQLKQTNLNAIYTKKLKATAML